MKLKFSLIFIITTFLIVLLFFGKTFSCQRLSCMDMKGLKDFIIKEVYKEDKDTFRALYNNQNEILRVEKLSHPDKHTSDQYVSAGISQIKGLFADSLAPYPGVASNTITCEKKYQPVFDTLVTSEKLEVTFFTAYLNQNMTYGSCTAGQVVYKGISAYFYCPKGRQTYHLEMILPIKDFESLENNYKDVVRSIRCK